jgi:hypothetical protein
MAEIIELIPPEVLKQGEQFIKMLETAAAKYTELAKVYDTISDKTRVQIKEEQELEKLNKLKLQTDAQVIKNEQALARELEKKVAAQNKAAKAAENENSAYVKLNNQHKEAVKVASDLAAKYGLLDKRTIEATKAANGFDKQLKDIDTSLGKNQRLVGGYSQALNLAGLSLGEMKKALRELKNTSFAGKSTEEVQALKLKIGQLTDAMGDAQSEMKMMGTENAAVLVGGLKFIAASVEGVVGTLSLFGVESETVKNLEKKMTSLIAVTQALAEIEDTISSGKLRAIGLRIKDMALTAKDSVIKWANSTATIAQSNAEKAKMVITGKASITTKAAAAVQWLWNAALAANPIGLIIVGVAALAAGITALVIVMRNENVELEKQKKHFESLQKLHEDEAAWNEFRLKISQANGAEEKKLLEQELRNLEDKRKANRQEWDELSAINYSKKKDIEEQSLKSKEYADNEIKIGDEIILLKAKMNKLDRDDVKKTNDEKDKLSKEERDNKLAIFIQEGKDFKANQEESVKVQETNKARREKADEEERAAKLAAFVKEGEDFKANQDETTRINKENEDRRFDYNIKKAEEEAAKKKELQQQYVEQSTSFVNSLFDLQQSRMDGELSALDAYYQTKIEAASNAGKNTEKLEAEYNNKRKKIEYDKAKSEQNQALFNVAIQTAQNVVKAYPNPYLIAGALAIGLAQAAIIKSEPLPAYAEGTDDAARTFLAGEAGVELMKLAGGGYELATKPKIYSGSKYEHAEIFPHDETQQILAANQMNGISMAGVERKLDSINKTVKESRAVVNIINKHDYRYAKRYERMGR